MHTKCIRPSSLSTNINCNIYDRRNSPKQMECLYATKSTNARYDTFNCIWCLLFLVWSNNFYFHSPDRADRSIIAYANRYFSACVRACDDSKCSWLKSIKINAIIKVNLHSRIQYSIYVVPFQAPIRFVRVFGEKERNIEFKLIIGLCLPFPRKSFAWNVSTHRSSNWNKKKWI